jgi:hypothetical protein
LSRRSAGKLKEEGELAMKIEVSPLHVQSALITVMVQLLAKLRETEVFKSDDDVRALLQDAADANRREYNPINQGAADFIEQVLMTNQELKKSE